MYIYDQLATNIQETHIYLNIIPCPLFLMLAHVLTVKCIQNPHTYYKERISSLDHLNCQNHGGSLVVYGEEL
jgi:hypothetical protein